MELTRWMLKMLQGAVPMMATAGFPGLASAGWAHISLAATSTRAPVRL